MANPNNDWVNIFREAKGEDSGTNGAEGRDSAASWSPWSSPTVVRPPAPTVEDSDGQAWQQLVQQMQQACRVDSVASAETASTTVESSTTSSNSFSSVSLGSNDSTVEGSSCPSILTRSTSTTTSAAPLPSRELVARLLGIGSPIYASETPTVEARDELHHHHQQLPQHALQGGGSDGLQFMNAPRRSSHQRQWLHQLMERRIQQVLPQGLTEERRRRATEAVDLMLANAGIAERQRSWYGENQGPRQLPQASSSILASSPAAQLHDEAAAARLRAGSLLENVLGARESQQERQQTPASKPVPFKCCVAESLAQPRALQEQLMQRDHSRELHGSHNSEDRLALTLQQLSQQATPQQQRLLEELIAAQGERALGGQQQIPLNLPFRAYQQQTSTNGENRPWQPPQSEATDEVYGFPPSHIYLAQGWIARERPTLLLAVQTLYRDQILPSGFNLKGRLLETGCSHQVATNFLDYYRQMTDVCRVEPYGSGEEVVYLLHPPLNHPGWVDANNPDDPYPEEMWHHFMHFVEALALSDCSRLEIGGGRYGMARFLQKRGFPFLSNYSLGQLCHIVQLAISKRKVLAYEDNILKPVNQCKKVVNAFLRLPERNTGKNHISTVPELQLCILELLKANPGGLTLSTLKRKIKLKFGKELSQTVFSCTKLYDLMQLPDIRTVCTIVKKARHIKIIPVRAGETPSSPHALPPLLPFGIDWTGPGTQRDNSPEGGMNPATPFSTLTQAFSRNSNSAAWLRADWGESPLGLNLMSTNGLSTEERIGNLAATFASIEPLTSSGLVDAEKEPKEPEAEQASEPNARTSEGGGHTAANYAEGSTATGLKH